jgi:hypothetical protein
MVLSAEPWIDLTLSPGFPHYVENPDGVLEIVAEIHPEGSTPDLTTVAIFDPEDNRISYEEHPFATYVETDWTVPDGALDGLYMVRVAYWSLEDDLAATEEGHFLVAPMTTGICAFKFIDLDNDGEFDEGGDDYLAEGWEICADGPDDFYDCQITNDEGYVCWFMIPPGIYEVCETLQAGYQNTTLRCDVFELAEDDIHKVMFGNAPIVPTMKKTWSELKAIYR